MKSTEINIAKLADVNQFERSHSRAEGGQNAGENTWKASNAAALTSGLLDTPEKLQVMRGFAFASGGWDEDEVAAWTPQEVEALFLQCVAGDTRDAGADTLAEINWAQYAEDAEAGRVSSSLYRDEDTGEIYFSLEA